MLGLFQPPDDPRHHIVVVRLGNLRPIEGPHHQLFVRSKVVDQHLAVDLRSVQRSPTLPKQFGLLALTLHQNIDFPADPFTLRPGTDLLLQLHQLSPSRLNRPLRNLQRRINLKRSRTIFIGIGENTEPINLRRRDKIAKLLEVLIRLRPESPQ